jgi:small subunit ribosomal protein S16
MLKIKLARFGKKHQPHYRIVVNEARDKRDGKYVALLGHYSPVTPKELVIEVALYQEWVKKGAQPTPTVAALFKRFQSGNPFPAKKAKPSKKAVAKAAAAKEAAVAPVAEAAPAQETPAPEVTPETTQA